MAHSFRILAMPDLFLDHFVLAGDADVFVRTLKNTISRGTRMKSQQKIGLGGNAYNFAAGIASLGCQVTFFTRTSSQLLEMLKQETKGLGISTRYVQTGCEPSLTVALEFSGRTGSGSVNINHPGSLQCIGREDVPPGLLSKRFDMISVFNFSNNRRGPELARHVFSSMKGIKLMDLPDPSSDFDDADSLKDAIELSDVVSCSAAEAVHASSLLGLNSGKGVMASASALSKLGPVVGVHSETLCIQASSGRCTSLKIRPVKLRSTTGAGDIWTAAYAYSILRSYSAHDRLSFASRHATAVLKKRNDEWPGG